MLQAKSYWTPVTRVRLRVASYPFPITKESTVPIYDLSQNFFNFGSDFNKLGTPAFPQLEGEDVPLGDPLLVAYYVTLYDRSKKNETDQVNMNIHWVGVLTPEAEEAEED